VQVQPARTPSSAIKASANSPRPCFSENFLLILHYKNIDLKHAFDRGGDFLVGQPVGPVQDPYDLGHGKYAHKLTM